MIVEKARAILPGASVSVLGLAGCLKAFDLDAFAHGLAAWAIVPSPAAALLAIVVVAAEVACAFAWFLDIRRNEMTRLAMMLLVAFSASYAIEAAVARPPDCNCFARIARFESHKASIYVHLARNALLVVGLSCRWLPHCPRGKKP